MRNYEEIKLNLLSAGVNGNTLTKLEVDSAFLNESITRTVKGTPINDSLIELREYLQSNQRINEPFDINAAAERLDNVSVKVDNAKLNNLIIALVREGNSPTVIRDMLLNGNPSNIQGSTLNQILDLSAPRSVLQDSITSIESKVKMVLGNIKTLLSMESVESIISAFDNYDKPTMSGADMMRSTLCMAGTYFPKERLREVLVDMLLNTKISKLTMEERNKLTLPLLTKIGYTQDSAVDTEFVRAKAVTEESKELLALYLISCTNTKKAKLSNRFASDSVKFTVQYEGGKPRVEHIPITFTTSSLFDAEKLKYTNVAIVMLKIPNWDYEYTPVGNKYNAEVTIRVDGTNPKTMLTELKGEDLQKIEHILGTGKLPLMASKPVREIVSFIQSTIK